MHSGIFFFSDPQERPCDSEPCLNGGQCLNSGVDSASFICLCPPDFTGATCGTLVQGMVLHFFPKCSVYGTVIGETNTLVA